MHIDWGGQHKIPVIDFSREQFKKVACRFFIGSPEIGGKLMPNSIIYGYTKIKNNGIIYRAHPYYQTKGSCYDWTYFKRDGYTCSNNDDY